MREGAPRAAHAGRNRRFVISCTLLLSADGFCSLDRNRLGKLRTFELVVVVVVVDAVRFAPHDNALHNGARQPLD